MSHITHKRVFAALAAPAVAAATVLAVASPAVAARAPRVYTTDSAGYSLAHAQFGSVQFRYVADTVYLRSPAGFAAIDDGVSWETHLSGTGPNGQPLEVDVNVGGDPQTESAYHAWADLNGQPMTTQGTTNFAAGRYVTESIYYNQAAGVVKVRVSDPNGDSFSGSAQVGRVSFAAASIVGGFDPGSSFTAPAVPVKLATFINATVTTYSGHRGFEARWYAHSKVFATSDGTASGVVRAAPSSLRPSGSWPYRAFDVYFEPAS